MERTLLLELVTKKRMVGKNPNHKVHVANFVEISIGKRKSAADNHSSRPKGLGRCVRESCAKYNGMLPGLQHYRGYSTGQERDRSYRPRTIVRLPVGRDCYTIMKMDKRIAYYGNTRRALLWRRHKKLGYLNT